MFSSHYVFASILKLIIFAFCCILIQPLFAI